MECQEFFWDWRRVADIERVFDRNFDEVCGILEKGRVLRSKGKGIFWFGISEFWMDLGVLGYGFVLGCILYHMNADFEE